MNKASENLWETQVKSSERFEFGANWMDYLSKLTDENIASARKSMNKFLPAEKLNNKSFLDIGSGSGLHSLVAAMDGAYVTSFDYDPASVHATQMLKLKFAESNDNWNIRQGSILDKEFIVTFSEFDIVYSWGVLHHTGSMWSAITNAIKLVGAEGYFFIAIYNKQGWKSRFWWYIKRAYNKIPKILKKPYAITLGIFFNALNIIKYTLLLKPQVAITPLLKYREGRGMNWKTDLIDWMGGFPYEYATVEELETFFKSKGFTLEKVKRTGSLGCNELLFKRV